MSLDTTPLELLMVLFDNPTSRCVHYIKLHDFFLRVDGINNRYLHLSPAHTSWDGSIQ